MKPVIFGLLLIFILNSCRKEILIDLPDHESLLVVNCFFTPEEVCRVKVSASASLYDNEDKDQDNALVLLYADDVIADTLVYTEDGIYISPHYTVLAETIYSLHVECDGFPAVMASNSAPSPVNITNSSLYRNIGFDESGYPISKIKFSFYDPAGKDNYYEIIVRNLDDPSYIISSSSIDTICLREGDYDFYPQTTLFRDQGIDGSGYTIEILISPIIINSNGLLDIDYILELRSISKEFYAYKKRLIRHVENQCSDIWDGMGNPLPMYSNIENGYGIFAGYSSSYDTLQ